MFLISDRQISLSALYKSFNEEKMLESFFQSFEMAEDFSPFVLKRKILISYRIIKIYHTDKVLKNLIKDLMFIKNFKKIIKYFLKMKRMDDVNDAEEKKMLTLDEIKMQTESIVKFFPGESFIEPVLQLMFNFCFLYDKTVESTYLRNSLDLSFFLNLQISYPKGGSLQLW